MIFHRFITIPTHPLMWCTISFILGIAYGGSSATDILTAIKHGVGCIAALILFFFLIFRLLQPFFFMSATLFLQLFRLLSMGALLSASFYLGSIRKSISINNYQSLVKLLTKEPINASARVLSIEHTRKRPFTKRLSIALTSLNGTETGRVVSLRANIQLSLIQHHGLKVGDNILINGLTLKPPTAESYQLYLCKEGFAATAFIPHLSYTLIKRPRYCFSRYRASVQKRLVDGFSKKISREAGALFYPLFLGIQASKSSSDIRRLHVNWGIVHYLARSGLHVILLAASWSYLLRFIPLNFFLKQFILLLLVLLYHLLTFPSISFLRALITFILYKLCIIQNLSFQPLHILSLTTLGVLIVNPLQLFFLDFQLSFGLTFALSWFNELRMQKQRFSL